jgi:hypothetical protein
MRALMLAYFLPLLISCTNPLGGKSSISSGFLAGLLPSNLPSITVTHSSITLTNTTAYSVSGGKSPYTVTTTGGTISSATGSGTLNPAGASGSIVLQVTDSAGSTAQTTVTIASSLTLGIGSTVPPNLARAYHVSASIAGKMYVFGGNTIYGMNNETWVLDPGLGTNGVWKQLSPAGTLPPGRYYSAAVTLSNKMYIFGGYEGSGPANDLWVFDPSIGSDGTWTPLSPTGSAPPVRFLHSASAAAGKMYVFYGYNYSSQYLNDIWAFDPSVGASGSWTQLTPTGTAPTARAYLPSATIANKIYTFGGDNSNGPVGGLAVFDPSAGANGSWTQLTPTGTAPANRYLSAMATVSGQMYMFGGCGGSGCPANDTWVYNPASGSNGSWTSLSNSGITPDASYAQTLVAISNQLYMFGGNNGPQQSTWVLTPGSGAAGSWAKANPQYIQNTTTLAANDIDSYFVSGGVPPFTVTTLTGTVDNHSGSGNYTAASSGGTDTIMVTDSLGNTATVTVNVNPALAITAALTDISPSSSTNYTVSGGIPPYTVSADNGSVDTPSGSGIYSANGSTGTATITVTDALYNSANVVINLPSSDLSVTLSQPWVDQYSSIAYYVGGGDGNYSVTTDNGFVDTNNNSGTYYANANSGIANISVTDAGITANATVAVYAQLSLTVGNYYPYLGDTTTYTISGGSGNYNVYTYYGSYIDNGSGSGNFTANGYYNYDYIYVQDNVTGENTSVQLSFSYYPLSISVDNSNLNYGDATNYYISGGSGNYSVGTSNGGGYSNSWGSGTYYADPCCGYNYDYINVYDYNTYESVSVYISINYPALSLVVNNTTMNVGDSTAYTVSGGSGNYNISVDYGSLDNSGGSGNYTALGGGYVNIIAYDYSMGNSVYQQIVVYGNLLINLTPEALSPSGTASYSAVNQNSSSYSWNLDSNSISAGAAIDTVNGPNGTFTAPGTPMVADLTLTDDLGNTGTYPINVTTPGTWTESPGFAGRYLSPAVTINNKMYIFGGESSSGGRNDTWVFDPSVGTNGSWTQLMPSGTLPPARLGHTTAAINNKMYVFGGQTNSGYVSDLWVFDPSNGANGSWSQVTPSGSAPTPRLYSAAVTINNKMYIFGGYNSGQLNDTCVFDPSAGTNGSWTHLSPTGTPTARYGQAATVMSNKMYIFGGWNGGNLNDTWVFDPSNGANGSWTQLSPSGSPGGRYFASAVAISTKMYLFYGNASGGYQNDVWVFDSTAGANGSWTQLSPSGTTPSNRMSASVAAISGNVYVFSGYSSGYNIETWLFNPSSSGSWTLLNPTGIGPSARYFQSMVTINNKMYVYAGYSNGYLSDLWSFDPSVGTLGLWTQLSPTGTIPAARHGQLSTMISNKMYVFGGCGSSGCPNSETWVFDPSTGASGTWTQLSPANPPPGRYYSAATTVSNKMYIFGGCGASGCPANDTWVFDPSAGANGSWTQLYPSTSPPARYFNSAVTISNKMYIFGGVGSSGEMNDTWAFDPSTSADGTWTQLTPQNPPSARYSNSAVTLSNKMYIFGGVSAGDAAVFSFDPSNGAQGQWLAEPSTGTVPPIQYYTSGVVISGKMVIFGGNNPVTNDTYLYQPSP